MSEPRVVIIVAQHGGSAPRDKAWPIVRQHFEEMDLPIFRGDAIAPGTGRFWKTKALNEAYRAAGDWDIALQIDADSVVLRHNAWAAIHSASSTGLITFPYDHYYGLSEGGYRSGVADVCPCSKMELRKRWVWNSDPATRGPNAAPSGTLVVPRKVFDRVGGYDERFKDWGFEDAAFLVAAGQFNRLAGPLYHFWHEATRRRGPNAGQWPEYDLYRAEYAQKPVYQYHLDEKRWLSQGPWSW